MAQGSGLVPFDLGRVSIAGRHPNYPTVRMMGDSNGAGGGIFSLGNS